ncbi:MAG: extracellular solute-binding protein [Chloroflexi bacterium]|nr:extracellular solute-binding protein [Chloroflexota bacterium]
MASRTTRRMMIGAGSAAAAALPVSCVALPGGDSSPAGSSQSKQPATVQVLTVRVGTWASELNEIGGAFTAKQPHIKVEWNNFGQGGPGVQAIALAGAGQLFDIVNFGVVTTGPLAARGALLGLNKYINRDRYDLKDFWPWCTQGVKWKGEIYAMHGDNNANLLYYNRNLFQQAGVALPTTNWTWDNLLDAARKLTRRAGDNGVLQRLSAASGAGQAECRLCAGAQSRVGGPERRAGGGREHCPRAEPHLRRDAQVS